MRIKKYIAVFFVLLFTVKSMAVDGKAILYMFDSSSISLVNPNCKKTKQAYKSNSSEKSNFSENVSTNSLSIGCITLFDIKTLLWTQVIHERIFSPFDYLPLHNGVVYKNSNYPPPRV